MPPVQRAGDHERGVLEHVHERMRDREVIGGGDVPGPDHGDVQEHREGRMRERPGASLEVVHDARDRSQDHLREAEDREDRDGVEQQHVLDHVHEEQLVGERVDRRDQRDQRQRDRREEAAQAPHGRLARASRRAPAAHREPALDVDPGDDRDGEQDAGAERPRQVRAHLRRLSHSGPSTLCRAAIYIRRVPA